MLSIFKALFVLFSVSFLFCEPAFGGPSISIYNPAPADGSVIGSLNPLLSVEVLHAAGTPMDITFQEEISDGEFRTIVAYSGVFSGRYLARPGQMLARDNVYAWRVVATDGESTVISRFDVEIAPYIGRRIQAVLYSDCNQDGYIKPGRERGTFFAIAQRGNWAAYHIDRGWYRRYQRTMQRSEMGRKSRDLDDGGALSHPTWGYWDGMYHIIETTTTGTPPANRVVSSRTFEGFGEMVYEKDLERIVPQGEKFYNAFFSLSQLGNDRVITFSNVPKREEMHPATARRYPLPWFDDEGFGYQEWTKEGGWSQERVIIGDIPFAVSRNLGNPLGSSGFTLVRHTRDDWYVFFVHGDLDHHHGFDNHPDPGRAVSTLKYFKSVDGGKTWGEMQDTGIPGHPVRTSAPSVSRYGDNYYITIPSRGNAHAYFANHPEEWSAGVDISPEGRPERQHRHVKWFWPHTTLLHQSALISVVTRGYSYMDNQLAIVTEVPEMLSNPGRPFSPSPADNSVTGEGGRSSVQLSVEVSGPQTYDVSFYLRKAEEGQAIPVEHDEGTFVELDRLLRDGDRASITLKGLEPGRYEWYAVSRGALLEYYGGEPLATSDEARSDIYSFTVAGTVSAVVKTDKSPAIRITAPLPADDGVTGEINPFLYVDVSHAEGRDMDITFWSGGSGEFEEVLTYRSVPPGRYQARPRDMIRRGTTYSWKVSATDGDVSVERIFSFNLPEFIGNKEEIIMDSEGVGFGYIRPGHEKGRFYATANGGMWAGYDINRGWYKTFQSITADDEDLMPNPFWGRWDGSYRLLGNRRSDGNGFEYISAGSFEELGMQKSADIQDTGIRTHTPAWQEGTVHVLSEDRAILLAIDYDESETFEIADEDKEWIHHPGRGVVKYWDWRAGDGWTGPFEVGRILNHTGRAALVRHTRDTWYIFVTEGQYRGSRFRNSAIRYFKSTDGGKTWDGPESVKGTRPPHPIYSGISFARYGDNYWAFRVTHDTADFLGYADAWVSFTWNGTCGYNHSQTLEDWTFPYRGHVTQMNIKRGMKGKPHGTLLHQSALISTVGDRWIQTGLEHNDAQLAIITIVPEMVSYPENPSDALPADGTVLEQGVSSVELSVEVAGPQTYDVAFYLRKLKPGEVVPMEHAEGTFVREDKLLREGDRAKIEVEGLEPGRYEWYAVSRGALLEYYGSEPLATSDEAWSDVYTFIIPE